MRTNDVFKCFCFISTLVEKHEKLNGVKKNSYVVCLTTSTKFYKQENAFGTRNRIVAIIVIAFGDRYNGSLMFDIRQTNTFDENKAANVYGKISYVVIV